MPYKSFHHLVIAQLWSNRASMYLSAAHAAPTPRPKNCEHWFIDKD